MKIDLEIVARDMERQETRARAGLPDLHVGMVVKATGIAVICRASRGAHRCSMARHWGELNRLDAHMESTCADLVRVVIQSVQGQAKAAKETE